MKSKIKRKILVFATARSGTNLFINLINQHRMVYLEGELLSHELEVEDPYAHIRTWEAGAIRPVFGFKLLTYQLERRFSDRAGYLDYLMDEGYEIFYLRRRNVLDMAISRMNALHTGQFHHYPRRTKDKRVSSFQADIDQLFREMRDVERYHLMEEEVLDGKPYLKFDYEEDMADPDRHQAMMDRVWEHLGVKRKKVKAKIKKSVPLRLDEFLENYDEVKDALMGTSYEQFLTEG